ncbi:hypothetical protein J6A31_03355 [bacterium]|nr:hypothetical protein [bacterium]
MHKKLMIFSLLIVCGLAFLDAKTRFEELKEISVMTPSQMEMKRDLQKSTGDGLKEKRGNTSEQFAYPRTHNRTQPRQKMSPKMNLNFQDSDSVNEVNTYSP